MSQDLYEPIRTDLRQGDIFEPLPSASLAGSAQNPIAELSKNSYRSILLNQSCDLDKGYKKLVVLPVLPLHLRNATDQNLIKKNRIFASLYLPAFGSSFPDCFVSFPEPTTVARSLLEACNRVVSLSEVGRRSLYIQYTRWLTRWTLAEISCPQCGVAFSPSDALPIENT